MQAIQRVDWDLEGSYHLQERGLVLSIGLVELELVVVTNQNILMRNGIEINLDVSACKKRFSKWCIVTGLLKQT